MRARALLPFFSRSLRKAAQLEKHEAMVH